jgi:hypothetical protein
VTGPELHPLVFRALGGRPAIPAREACLPLLRGATSVALRYEWVVDWGLLDEVIRRPDIALSDGQEWISLTIQGGEL